MLRFLFSLYVWLLVITVTIILSPVFVLIWLLTVLFDKRLVVLHYFANFWGSLFTILVPGWKVNIIDKNKLNRKTKIIVANHQSQQDILLMYRLGVPFRWISKAEVFRIPFYGWLMRLKGDIRLQRTSKASIKKMIIDAEKVLNKACTIAIFPEGTRSKTGELGNFKEGAFKLAQDTKVPIQPIVIEGVHRNLIYNYFMFKGKNTITVKVLDEIPYQDFKDEEIKDLAKRVRSMIEKELKILRNK